MISEFVCLCLDPTTCVFVSTTRDHPIHLWDAISGEVANSHSILKPSYEELILNALLLSMSCAGSVSFVEPIEHMMPWMK